MKIIHTADIHLDSKLSRHLSADQARDRRNELISTYNSMVQYALNERAQAILIAGDLFDVTRISATARNAVMASITDNPEMIFYYLRGNHDADSFIQDVIKKFGFIPENLKLFGDDWTSFTLIDDGRLNSEDAGQEVVITGAEINADNNSHLVNSLALDQSKFNILTLHGQETISSSKKDAEVIPIKDYRNRGIDYMALGHVHAPKIEKLDARGVYSYSGCLEGRGFDECGPRGFNVLTISGGKLDVEFIPFAKRVMHEIFVDVSDCTTSDEMIKSIKTKLAGTGDTEVLPEDMVRIVLSGEVSLDAEFDTLYIAKMLDNDYYYLTVKDKTSVSIDYNSFAYDKTMKGEFVRLVKAEQEAGNLSEEDAAAIIRTGVLLLAGEGAAL